MIKKNYCLYAISGLFLTSTLLVSCATSEQPNWAAEHAAAKNESVIGASKRTFLFKPLTKKDSRLDLQMLRIENNGTLILKSTYGIETLPLGEQVVMRGVILRLIASDSDKQTAVVESWPRL